MGVYIETIQFIIYSYLTNGFCDICLCLSKQCTYYIANTYYSIVNHGHVYMDDKYFLHWCLL